MRTASFTILIFMLLPFVGHGQLMIDTTAHWTITYSQQLIQDESRDPYYYYSIYNTNTWGQHDAYGVTRQQFGLRYTFVKKIAKKPFRWGHTIGYQSANQLYTGYYDVIETKDPKTGFSRYEVETHETRVKKQYLFYKTDLQIMLFKWMYVGPMLQVDYRLSENISADKTALQRFGVYDAQNDKLLFHPNTNFKLGAQVGFPFLHRFQAGINLLYGVNKSITVKPDHKWYNNQIGLYLNVKI